MEIKDGGSRSVLEEKMDKFPYSKLVITGGCGYVGQQLANAVREANPGIEIVLFDVHGNINH